MKKYYLGLDIGTDSVGYAVTDEEYRPLKFKGEPMMGVHLFDPSGTAAERRGYRTARRSLNRKQQRKELLQEIFAEEIAKVDKDFFIRIKKSRLRRDEEECKNEEHIFFNTPEYSDKDYYREYPTIHHLIYELMTDKKPHDVRLVYIACAWLVSHRGHFLNEVDKDNIEGVLDFAPIYENLRITAEEKGIPLWDFGSPNAFSDILSRKTGITAKNKAFYALLFGGKTPKDARTKSALTLLCGGKTSFDKIFANDEYKDLEVKSFSLGMPDEDFAAAIMPLGDDADYILKLKALYDWSILKGITGEYKSLSEAKIAVYEQHKEDLKNLKYLIRKYAPEKYDTIFKEVSSAANYAAYSKNVKTYNVLEDSVVPDKFGKNKEAFCDFLKKQVKDIKCGKEDEALFEDMMQRIDTRSFLPKQTDGDNRVIPYQLYWYELKKILQNAGGYLPFIKEKDKDGISAEEKILSVFTFRVPYFVGPLNNYKSNYAWMKRKAEGKIYPWNFNEKVDMDSSEQEFIRRMTAKCTYLPMEDVLPKNSLLYTKFNVLNEINNLKINGVKLSPEIKQNIYNHVFRKYVRVTPKRIKDYLISTGVMMKTDVLEGIDEGIKSSLKPWHDFSRLLDSGVLNEADAENIIERCTCTENAGRFGKWLKKEYPSLNDADVKYLRRLGYKDFGRLSKKLLTGILVTKYETGETDSVINWMWNTNYNFMQLTSDEFDLRSTISRISREYYDEHPMSLPDRLESMYVSPAVRRPIIRTLDVVSDIIKAEGCAPSKVFVEMARGADPDQKNKRTKSRKEQLLELYKKVDSEDVRRMNRQLDELGDKADNLLQSERLFLYFLQLGRCMYTGEEINIDELRGKLYDIDHIYPRCFVKDDSIINNKVLVKTEANSAKGDKYPVNEDIRSKMTGFWNLLKNNGLISEEKYKRLTRSSAFSAEERWQFINRQLVETRQSTKVIAELLSEKFPDSKIVYVKAGLVSEFRHEVLDISKSRSINDLHHAKDAYLNIVAGNVYNVKFTKNWFLKNWQKGYSIKAKTLFSHPLPEASWKGGESIEYVRKIMGKNAIHYVRYAFCRKGGLFDQMPVKAKSGLVPLKAGLSTEKYGGYNKPTASFFVLTEYRNAKKHDVIFMPVELMVADKFIKNKDFAIEYAKDQIEKIIGKKADSIRFPMNERIIKINTVLSIDGLDYCISGKASGGTELILKCATSNILNLKWEKYIKAAEVFLDKKKQNITYIYDEKYDIVNKNKNLELYDTLTRKTANYPFKGMRRNPIKTLKNGRDKFISLNIFDQTVCLFEMLNMLKTSRASACDFTLIGGVKNAAKVVISSSLSVIAKEYSDIRIKDFSASGIYCSKSNNLKELL